MLKTDLIKIEVNGTLISIPQDKRVLDAINLSEQKVPTLCFDERIGLKEHVVCVLLKLR